ncbi:microsomal cytochrome b5 [Cladochytrium replicatum]|nr:microsomal cytochrome b5 [Cladochytrium replicatum]
MSNLKTFVWADITAHNKRKDIWLVIEGKVYNITKFMDEHPGGEEVLLEQGGGDATEAFEEIGHSDDAKELLKEYLIGELKESEKAAKPTPAPKPVSETKTKTQQTSSSGVLFAMIPVAAIFGYVVYKLLEQPNA